MQLTLAPRRVLIDVLEFLLGAAPRGELVLVTPLYDDLLDIYSSQTLVQLHAGCVGGAMQSVSGLRWDLHFA